MAISQRDISIEKGNMLVTDNALINYESNSEFGGTFTTTVVPPFEDMTNSTYIRSAGADPINGEFTSNDVSTPVQTADLITSGNFVKSASPANVTTGDIITYTLIVTNTGNTDANRVILTDPIPTGTTYVKGSATASVPFSGSPETCITLSDSIPAGDTVGITYQVQVGNVVPEINPIPNTAAIRYSYTVNPTTPNDVTICSNSNTVTTPVYIAALSIKNQVDKVIAYIGDMITYKVAVTNIGNISANSVILTAPVSNGTVYVVGSLTANVPFTGSPMTTIHLTNPIAVGETVSLSYHVQVTAFPNPNPISNTIYAKFTYTLNSMFASVERLLAADEKSGSAISNTVNTVVFRNNYGQEISDLIHSVALQQAAIAGIANAEGAKIQKILSLGATPNELLCVNKSVSDMLEALGTLESVLKQKLGTVDCQINPTCL